MPFFSYSWWHPLQYVLTLWTVLFICQPIAISSFSSSITLPPSLLRSSFHTNRITLAVCYSEEFSNCRGPSSTRENCLAVVFFLWLPPQLFLPHHEYYLSLISSQHFGAESFLHRNDIFYLATKLKTDKKRRKRFCEHNLADKKGY